MMLFKVLTPEIICDEIVNDINSLLKQLSSNCFQYSEKSLKDFLLTNDFLTVLIVIDSLTTRTIGVGSILFRYMLSERAVSIGDIIIDQQYRGKGIGKELIKRLIGLIKEKNGDLDNEHKVKHISLTSHPSREEANKLYVKSGFQRRETNVYRLVL